VLWLLAHVSWLLDRKLLLQREVSLLEHVLWLLEHESSLQEHVLS
jgi:hypothetical protein